MSNTEFDLSAIENASPEDALKAFAELSASGGLEVGDVDRDDGRVKERVPTEVESAAKEVEGDSRAQSKEVAQDAPTVVAAAADAAPTGVLTKDGKHVIPYAVIEAERAKSARLASDLAQLRAQFESASASKNGESGEVADPSDAEGAEKLRELAEDFPAVAEMLAKIKSDGDKRFAELEKQLKPVANSVEEDRLRQHANSMREVEQALAENPKLIVLQHSHPERFKMAQQFDSLLRDQPEWADVPLAQRLAKVTELVEQAGGAITMAEAAQPQAAAPAPDPSKKDVAKKAAATLAQKAAAPPTSLTDFRGSQAPEVGESAQVAEMSHQELAAKFATMSPKQQRDYLERFA